MLPKKVYLRLLKVPSQSSISDPMTKYTGGPAASLQLCISGLFKVVTYPRPLQGDPPSVFGYLTTPAKLDEHIRR